MTTTTTVLDELRRIAAARAGTLTPQAVVEAAEAEDSPLHSHFEWDDAEAAVAHRLSQARGLIRSVRVQLVAADGEQRTVRAFVHTMPPKSLSEEDATQPVYRRIEDVAADEGARRVFLGQLEVEWRSFRRRWRDYEYVLSDLVMRDLMGGAE